MAEKATKIVALLEEEIASGMGIPKPQARADFTVKGWGKRRGERALIYRIPNHSNPRSPHEKGVTVTEWEKAFDHLLSSGEFSRKWFDHSMTACAKEGGCNFTTIGGIFEFLGYAEYCDHGVYRLTSEGSIACR